MLYNIHDCVAQYLLFLHMHKTPQTHLPQRGLSNLSKTKFGQNLPSLEIRHSMGSHRTIKNSRCLGLLVSLGGGKEAPAKCWDKVSSWDTGYMSSHTATELAASFQAVLFCFLWRCHIPVWILLAHHFNSPCKGLGQIFFLLQCPGVSWRTRSCQCFYFNSLFLW